MRSKTLTSEMLERLLHWLAPERERAAERYQTLQWRLILFFQQNNCHIPDELADETMDRVARRLAEGENVLADNYCFGVAKRVLQEYWRKRVREQEA